MSITPTIKRALRRGGGAASVWLPPDRGPEAWQHLVGRARVAEGRRRLRGLKDPDGAERLVVPLLESPVGSRAWALVSRESARAWVRAERDWSSIVKIVDGVYQALLAEG